MKTLCSCMAINYVYTWCNLCLYSNRFRYGNQTNVFRLSKLTIAFRLKAVQLTCKQQVGRSYSFFICICLFMTFSPRYDLISFTKLFVQNLFLINKMYQLPNIWGASPIFRIVRYNFLGMRLLYKKNYIPFFRCGISCLRRNEYPKRTKCLISFE